MSTFTRILAAATLAMTACVDTTTTTCAEGGYCAPGDLCVSGDAGQARCEPASLVTACDGKQEADVCMGSGDAGAAGQCRARVCIAMGCGNGHVDLGEACDDANGMEGDGCSSDCQRRCGDEIVQPENGELCDAALPLEAYCLDRGFDMGRLTCAPSCQDVSTKSCIDFDWQPMAGLPDDLQIIRTWVLSPENVIAVGGKGDLSLLPDLDVCPTCGSIFRYDGKAWTEEELTDVPLLLDVWASGPEDIYAVGAFGTILHFDGNEWTKTRLSSELHPIAIWGTGPDEVFAVGMRWRPFMDLDTATFMALRYDGRTWTLMDMSQASSLPRSMLHGIWGTESSGLFAVGNHDAILHYDGNPEGIWTPMARAPDATPIGEEESLLLDIWGTRGDNVVAVGENGRILRYDGAYWSPMESHTNQGLLGIWGDEQDRFFAVGANGTLLRYDPFAGDEWVALASGTQAQLFHIHGSEPSNVLAVGSEGTALRSGDNGWAAMDLQENQSPLTSIWGSDIDCIYATTESGTIWHYDGNADWRWTPMATGLPHLRSIHGLGCGQDLYAVGWNGTILRYANGTWATVPSPSSTTLRAVRVIDSSSVFAVGENGTILHYDGNQDGRWEPMESGVDVLLTGVWGTNTSPDDVFAVGDDGTVLRYDGTTKSQWTAIDTEASWRLHAVWGSGPNDVFAAGDGGQLIHYDGETWTSMNDLESIAYLLRSLWGRSARDIFAGSQNGKLFHYDGDFWSPMRSPTDHRISSFWGTADGKHLLIADALGRIFRLARPAL